VSEQTLNAFEQKLLDDIRDFGCQVLHVFDGNGNEPGFSY